MRETMRMKMLYQPTLYIWKITFALRIITYIITYCIYQITFFFAYVITFFCVYHHLFLRMSSPFFCVYHHLFYLHRHLFLPTSSPFLPRASPCVYVYHHLCFTFALAPLNHLYFTFLIQLADPHEYNTRLSQPYGSIGPNN